MEPVPWFLIAMVICRLTGCKEYQPVTTAMRCSALSPQGFRAFIVSLLITSSSSLLLTTVVITPYHKAE
ncbi:MAG: hypothetical protein WBM35_13750 [Candidatus Electrothrix sp.]